LLFYRHTDNVCGRSRMFVGILDDLSILEQP